MRPPAGNCPATGPTSPKSCASIEKPADHVKPSRWTGKKKPGNCGANPRFVPAAPMFCRSLASLTLAAALSGAAVAGDVKATATYGITLGGTNIASVTVRLTDTGQRYAMALDARVTGFAQMVASGIA